MHTVGPVWSPAEDRSALLADCHRNALRVAAELGAGSVAFPAISTGIYRWPLESAADIAIGTVMDVLATGPGPVRIVRFVLRGAQAYRTFTAVAARHGLEVPP